VNVTRSLTATRLPLAATVKDGDQRLDEELDVLVGEDDISG
jgi:hypothetical protein